VSGAQPETAQEKRAEEVKRMLAEALRACAPRLRGHRVVLFGSRARGDARPRSDFDIGVDGGQPLPLPDFYAVEDTLDALPTLYKIDWVDLCRVSPEFRARALQHTETLYEPPLDPR
jgi:predicted nucleotidyltransferase